MRDAIVFRLKLLNDTTSIFNQDIRTNENLIRAKSNMHRYEKTTVRYNRYTHEKITLRQNKKIKKSKTSIKEYIPPESVLVREYNTFRKSKRFSVLDRPSIEREGLSKPLWVDGYCDETKTLYEAKNESSREKIRMAIGQLYDYNMDINADNCVVLVPSLPNKDLVDLILSRGFKLVYKKGKEFLSIPEDFLD